MEKALSVLNELESGGLIERYAIGGAMAAMFYIEPVTTYDLDVFIVLPPTASPIVTLSPIYDFLLERGYHADREYVQIGGVPVQFLPAHSPLLRDAVEQAQETLHAGVLTFVLRPEHLIAIMLDTYRPKDKTRLVQMLDEAEFNHALLTEVIERHGLSTRWDQFRRQFGLD